MTKDQNSLMTTGCSIRDFAVPNAAIINALVNGASNVTILGTTLGQIQVENEIQKMKKTGYVSTMKSLKVKLIYEATDTARKLITFAKFTKNMVLLDEIKNAKLNLSKCTKADLVSYAQLIYDRAQSNLAALAPYNVTAATQLLLLNATTPFNAILGKTSIGRGETSQSTQRMKVLFATLFATITALDDAVETVRTSKPDFYKGYHAVRKVLRNRGQKSMLKCIVVDEQGSAIESVFVVLYLLGADGLPLKTKGSIIKKKTGKKGGFNLQTVPDGDYLGEFTNLQFEDMKPKFTLKKGQRVDLKVVMKSMMKP